MLWTEYSLAVNLDYRKKEKHGNRGGEDLDTLTGTFSTAITDTAMGILGKHWPKKKKMDQRWHPWDVWWKERAEEKETWRTWSKSVQRNKQQNKESHRNKRRKPGLKNHEEIDTNLTKNNTKRAHQMVTDLTTTNKEVSDKSGKSLTEDGELLTRWTEYCNDLYIYDTGWPCRTNWTSFHQPGWLGNTKRRSWGSSEISQARRIRRGGQHISRTHKQEEKPWLMLSTPSAAKSGKPENGQPSGHSDWSWY